MSVDKALKNLNCIEREYKFVVYGFVRESEAQLLAAHDRNIFYFIPELVTIICLVFYNIGQIFGDVSTNILQSGDDRYTLCLKKRKDSKSFIRGFFKK